jgi:phosphoesterase RecJ-like protein
MVDVLGNIDGVEICVLFKDYDGPKVKISMRSRGKATVNDVAEQLGGGGHPKAAGADVLMPLDEAIAKTLPLLRAKLSPSDPK